MIDWKQLPQFKSIGKIPSHGDCYYDGVLDAHNDNYFITYHDDIWEDSVPEHKRTFATAEHVFLVYEMDDVLRAIYQINENFDAVIKAREYSEDQQPVGYILEGDLWDDRVND